MRILQKSTILILFIAITGLTVSCNNDEMDDVVNPTGNEKTYLLSAVANSGVSGSVTVIELNDGTIEVSLELQGTPSGGVHPAHIHANTAAETGGIIASLAAVDGSSGTSTTILSALDDGTAIDFEQFLSLDSYINVHLSAEDLATIVAQGDIGQNELTGEMKSYDLEERAVATISGSATFYERVNGEALAVLSLMNTPEGGTHPAHIHVNTAAEGGGIAFTFNPVDGSTGESKTNVAALDNGTAITYTNILSYDGYINVHLSADDLGTIVAQGDIGQNELTGEMQSYELGERAVAGISGSATFYERANGEALAVLALINTPDGGSHPAHIHNNSADEGGGIAFTFNPVDGTTGVSKTNVGALDDGSALTYTEILSFNGYINVHLSADDLATIVAQGNIGSNAGAGQEITYEVTNSGSSAYIFNGNELTNSQNPDITLQRGMTYQFNLSAAGHPFIIKTEQTTGTAGTYSGGVTNNGTDNGTITFVVPNDAPAVLYYICEFHSPMTGMFTITD